MHLGMTGRFSVQLPPPLPVEVGGGRRLGAPAGSSPARRGERVSSSASTPTSTGATPSTTISCSRCRAARCVTYNDARRFGYMTLIPAERPRRSMPSFAGLGVEPLGDELDRRLSGATRARPRRSTSRRCLMDQRIVAGLGNIYVCEALFRAGLDPFKPAARLATKTGKPTPAAGRLVPADQGGAARCHPRRRLDACATTSRPTARSAPSSTSSRSTAAKASLASRPGCRGRVRRKTQGGRSTFYCPACQR